MRKKHIEQYFLEVMKNQRRGIFASMLRFFLYLFSKAYHLFVTCRNWAFDHGWLRRYSPPVPLVISVGNLVVGGTGKTPVTLLLAKEFTDTFPLAILSRGYRSKAEKLPHPTCLCREKGQLYPASFCGDEPYLLAQNLPKAQIFVGRNRHNASILAAKSGTKVILLDDGMQHRRLSRDLDVVIVDARDPFGQGHFLPRGFLREDVKGLSRANLIILNHIESSEQFAETTKLLEPYSVAPVVGMKMQINGIFNFQNEQIESLTDKKVGLFCGIAHPEYFETTVQSLGAKIVNKYIVEDHRNFDPLSLESFAKCSSDLGAELLVCTEKDRVKFSETLNLALPVVWIKIELTIVEGQQAWDNFIQKAKSDLTRRM